METMMQKIRIHPLMAGAAVAVIIASAVAVGAMTNRLPGSSASPAPAQTAAPAQTYAAATPPVAQAPVVAPARAAPAVAPHPADLPPPAPRAASACPNCGVVASVDAYEAKPQKSVVGMVGGGVVGALVGSQIGHGTTNTVATVGGAAGGAYLGNEIGKKVQTKTHYKVVVRMDGGGTRSFTYAARPDFQAGSQVRVENGTLVRG